MVYSHLWNCASRLSQVQHVVELSQLRPAWKWDEKVREWGVHDKLPPHKDKATAPRKQSSKKGKA